MGIGCSLALACDLIVAAESAYFRLAFVNLGLALDGGASQTLAARVGNARAFEMAYLGDQIAAARAQSHPASSGSRSGVSAAALIQRHREAGLA